MAVQSKQGPTQAPNKTPAPDEISRPRAGTPAGHGQNGPQPSSVDPGKAVLSPLAANLKSSVTDPALDVVIARGTYKSQVVTDDEQLRQIAAGNVPSHDSMRDPNSGNAKVPPKCGFSSAEPIRKPTA